MDIFTISISASPDFTQRVSIASCFFRESPERSLPIFPNLVVTEKSHHKFGKKMLFQLPIPRRETRFADICGTNMHKEKHIVCILFTLAHTYISDHLSTSSWDDLISVNPLFTLRYGPIHRSLNAARSLLNFKKRSQKNIAVHFGSSQSSSLKFELEDATHPVQLQSGLHFFCVSEVNPRKSPTVPSPPLSLHTIYWFPSGSRWLERCQRWKNGPPAPGRNFSLNLGNNFRSVGLAGFVLGYMKRSGKFVENYGASETPRSKYIFLWIWHHIWIGGMCVFSTTHRRCFKCKRGVLFLKPLIEVSFSASTIKSSSRINMNLLADSVLILTKDPGAKTCSLRFPVLKSPQHLPFFTRLICSEMAPRKWSQSNVPTFDNSVLYS